MVPVPVDFNKPTADVLFQLFKLPHATAIHARNREKPDRRKCLGNIGQFSILLYSLKGTPDRTIFFASLAVSI
jgi:hypothetical protein